MKIPTTKIWFKNFFKSFIWLIFPLCVFGDILNCSSYKEAGKHLSSYSVSVNGYYRRDGTYVRSYNRRPPGGVTHDAPYKSKQFWTGTLFLLCLVGGIGSIIVYRNISINEIEVYREKNSKEELERKKILIEEEHAIKLEEERIRNEQKQIYIKTTLEEISGHGFSFTELNLFPNNLYLSQSFYRCKFCKKYVRPKGFYIAFKATKHIHVICPSCVEIVDFIGKGQPSTKFIPALNFIKYFNKRKEEFIEKFILASSGFNFNRKEIEIIFYSELNRKSVNK